MIKPEIEVVVMGANNTGYPEAFTPKIEDIIKKTVGKPCLHLFSGRCKIGDVRVDIERPEATHNMNVLEFIESNNDQWKWLVLDPPYDILRKNVKLKEYGLSYSLAADVVFRKKMVKWFQGHVENILWLDGCAPSPKGFYRKKLWLCLPGSYHNVRVLSWLQREGSNLSLW